VRVGEDGQVHEYAITLIGGDRPGIIAEAAAILADLRLNLTDSTMTRLRGHFAMTLVCAGDAHRDQVEGALAPMAAGSGLVLTVRELGSDAEPTPAGGPFGDAGEPNVRQCVLSLHGADRLGIVAAVTRVLADAGGNITDLTTRLAGDLYVLVAEVDLPSTVDFETVTARLDEAARAVGVEATLRPADPDLL
jgi:glycine cleavage system transcriptional repressor